MKDLALIPYLRQGKRWVASCSVLEREMDHALNGSQSLSVDSEGVPVILEAVLIAETHVQLFWCSQFRHMPCWRQSFHVEGYGDLMEAPTRDTGVEHIGPKGAWSRLTDG